MSMLTASPRREALWESYYRRWQAITPPLRPHAEVCSAVGGLIADHAERVLLLGVTPELCALARQTVAVDLSGTSLVHVWPGDGTARRGIRADWLHLPCAAGGFSAAVGDGSLSCLEYPSGYRRVLSELARAVRTGGRIVLRLFSTPAVGESVSQVRDAAMAGRVGTIHALKWRLAHAICAERGEPNIDVRSILRAFNRECYDRAALGRATGWSTDDIGQIDAYDQMPDVYSFPTLGQVLAVIPARLASARLRPAGTYELAERCPLLVLEVAR